MKRNGLFTVIGILCVAIGGMSCHDNTLTLPEPATSLEGIYETQSLVGPFLVSGETAQLALKRISADSVAISLRAFSKGQPSDSLSLGHMLVREEFGNGCVGYRIKLPPVRTDDELRMTCSEENVFYYQYAFSINGQQVSRSIKFKRIP